MATEQRNLQNSLRNAVRKGDVTAVSRLLKGGVPPNDSGWFQTNLLHEAVTMHHHNRQPSEVSDLKKKTIDELIRHGADPNVRDSNDRTPLHSVARDGNVSVLKHLITKGADINAVSEDKRSPLHVALWQNHEKAALCLIELGADVNIADGDGTTPLHWAVRKNKIDVMMELLKKGAKINAQDKNGRCALHLAVEASPDVMRILLTQGADMLLKTNFNRTVLHLLDGPQTRKPDILFKMIVKAGYPIHFDHKVLQRKLRVFQSHPDLLDWINEVEDKYPPSLLHLVRLAMRTHLTNIRGSKMLDEKLFDLKGILPEPLINSLWMIDDFIELKSLW